MAYIASGEPEKRPYPCLIAGERVNSSSANEPHARRLNAQKLLVLITLLIVGFALVSLISRNTREIHTDTNQITAYVARPTPAIDALGDKLTKKPEIWTTTEKPNALFQIRSLELQDLPSQYTVREHGLGGREDILSFGNFTGNELYLHFSIYHMGLEALSPSTFFVDLVRRSAESEVSIVSTGRPIMQETKFGPSEVADATLHYNSEERQCTAFNLMVPAAGSSRQISGWACDAIPVTADEISCFIDHLALTSSVEDAALSSLFSNANQRQRSECGGVPVPVPPLGE